MKNKQTETKSKSTPGVANLLTWIVCWGTLNLVCSSAPAQNLFVSSDAAGGNIYEFTPNGVRSTFASGVAGPLAFDKAGNLFVADSDNIYKITPAGWRTTFGPGLEHPLAMASDNAGNLFVSAWNFGSSTPAIYKITSGGVGSTFALGLSLSAPMACDSAGNLFVSDFGDNIYKFTPSGVRSTFATGM